MGGRDLSVARRLVLLRLLLRLFRFLRLGRLISFGLGRGLGTRLGSLRLLLLGLRSQPRRLRLRASNAIGAQAAMISTQLLCIVERTQRGCSGLDVRSGC